MTKARARSIAKSRERQRIGAVERLLSLLKRGDTVGGVGMSRTLSGAWEVALYRISEDSRERLDLDLVSAATGYRIGKYGLIVPVPSYLRIRPPIPYGWGADFSKIDALASAVRRMSFVLFGNERLLKCKMG